MLDGDQFNQELQKAKDGDTDACRQVFESLEQLANAGDKKAASLLGEMRRQIRKEIEKSPELKAVLFKAAMELEEEEG
jgi:hypothetical protein